MSWIDADHQHSAMVSLLCLASFQPFQSCCKYSWQACGWELHAHEVIRAVCLQKSRQQQFWGFWSRLSAGVLGFWKVVSNLLYSLVERCQEASSPRLRQFPDKVVSFQVEMVEKVEKVEKGGGADKRPFSDWSAGQLLLCCGWSNSLSIWQQGVQ